jgi:hypothetical protein
VIRTQMLLSSGISVAAPDYFAIATGAIDSVFAWISECEVQLTQLGTVHHGSYQSTLLHDV